MFSFENGPYTEMVPNASESLGDTLNIWDNDHALVSPKMELFKLINLWVLIKVGNFLFV
jgi:hypothetical protein